jgi:hypothetical protein
MYIFERVKLFFLQIQVKFEHLNSDSPIYQMQGRLTSFFVPIVGKSTLHSTLFVLWNILLCVISEKSIKFSSGSTNHFSCCCSACGEWGGALSDDELVQQLRHAHRGRGSLLTRDTQLSDTGEILTVMPVCSVAEPHVFGPSGSGSTSQRYGSGSGSGS